MIYKLNNVFFKFSIYIKNFYYIVVNFLRENLIARSEESRFQKFIKLRFFIR